MIQPQAGERFMRVAEVCDRVQLSRSQIFRLETAGKFPRRRRLGARTNVWLASEIDTWMRARPFGDDQRPDAAGDLPSRGFNTAGAV